MCTILSTTVPALRLMKSVIIRTDMASYTFSQNHATQRREAVLFCKQRNYKQKSLQGAAGTEEGRNVRRPSAAGGVKNVTLTCEPSFLQFHPLTTRGQHYKSPSTRVPLPRPKPQLHFVHDTSQHVNMEESCIGGKFPHVGTARGAFEASFQSTAGAPFLTVHFSE